MWIETGMGMRMEMVTGTGIEMGTGMGRRTSIETGMGMGTGAGTVGNEYKFPAEPGGTSPALASLELVRDRHWNRAAAPPAWLSPALPQLTPPLTDISLSLLLRQMTENPRTAISLRGNLVPPRPRSHRISAAPVTWGNGGEMTAGI